jgi:hypothetical protein
MSDVDTVRLLIGDLLAPPGQLFDDDQLQAFLDLETANIKRAAADALDAIATSEVLVSKVITSQDVSTDGAKVADALRKGAAALREQADLDDERGDGFYFDVVEMGSGWIPELTEWPYVGIC